MVRARVGELARARLADHGHLDLAGILERILDLGGDLTRQERCHVVADLAGLDHHTHIATGLHREAALDAGVTHGDLFKRLETLDVLLEALAARTRPGGGDRVSGDHENCFNRIGLHVVVVRLNGVCDGFALAELAAELPGDDGMGTFDLVRDGLANVVEQRSAASDAFVDPKLDRHDRSEM